MYLNQILTASTILIGSALTAPLTTRQSPEPQCVNGIATIFQPTLHDIYIYRNIAPFPSGPTNTLNVMNGSTTGSEQQQVAQFTNIPSTATSCTLGWAMTAQRAFSVYNNGLLRFEQMTGLPEGDITVDSIKPFEVVDPTDGGLDFTAWPETVGARTNIGGPVDCGAEVVVKLYKDIINASGGSVTMEQNEGNGLFLRYNC